MPATTAIDGPASRDVSGPDGLRIRHVEPADYEAVWASMNTPKSFAGTLQLPYASRESWRKRIADMPADATMLVAEVRNPETPGGYEIVGNAGLHPFGPSLRRRHAMGLGIAVRDDWQCRGIGSALMAALIERADRWMNVLRIELTVYTDNESARRLYERFGFVVEGTHRAFALRDGVYVDAYAMARLHPSPPVLPSAAAT